MKKKTLGHHIAIAGRDPARAVIAADIVRFGGRPVAGESLIYAFYSPHHRDRALRDIRGCFGTDCVTASEGER